MLDADFYRPIIKFFALFLGDKYEISLCDQEKILVIENPMDNSRQEGSPIDDFQKSFFHNPEIEDISYSVNYRSLSSTGEKLRSATMFIRDKNNNNLKGLLNINYNVSELLHLRECIDTMINGEQSYNTMDSGTKDISRPKQYYETVSLSVAEMIANVVNDAMIRFGTTPDRLTPDERLSVIREMDKRGVFLAKGSVDEVAEILGSSKATIYRYLQQINK